MPPCLPGPASTVPDDSYAAGTVVTPHRYGSTYRHSPERQLPLTKMYRVPSNVTATEAGPIDIAGGWVIRVQFEVAGTGADWKFAEMLQPPHAHE
jgi:hypothetical protein